MFQKHTIPFGPNVVLIKSAIAMAPINDACKDMAVQKNQKVHRSHQSVIRCGRFHTHLIFILQAKV
jgi:hypothetical protein